MKSKSTQSEATSCVEQKTPAAEGSKSALEQLSKSDSLKFTSGIRAILQDRTGQYWFGSHKEGACLFDGTSFTYFTTKEGLPDNQIRSIQEDKHGTIWFGTANGVCSYDGNHITNYTPTPIYHPTAAWENTDDYLWFNAGSSSGINRFDGKQLTYVPFPIPENEKGNNSYGVTDMSTDKDGEVWIATYAALFHFDGQAITMVEESQLALQEGETLHIRSVFADSKGRVWIGNNGIGVLLHQGDSSIHFSETMGLIHANSSGSGGKSPAGTLEHVFVIEEDGEGNIWFGDRDTGAWKYDGESMTNYTIDATLTTQMIWHIGTDQNNELLFAMADGGIYAFTGKSFDKKF